MRRSGSDLAYVSLYDRNNLSRRADYHRQDHPNRLIFRYVVASGVVDNDGFKIGDGADDSITLTGNARIRAVSDNTNARLSFDVQQTTWNINGNQVAPTGGICGDGYHPAVLKAIVRAVPQAADCSEITSADLAQIDSLDVSGEDVGSLHKRDFRGLPGLLTLDLSGNALDHLPSNLFDHVATLTKLKLNGNDIAALPANVFNRLTALTDLTLQGNDIAALPANVFARLTALRRLDLRGNALTGLPAGVFAALTDLRGLRLSNNALASLPDNVFAPLTKLENGALWITNNPGFADFVPRITVAVPAQTVRPGVRVDLEAVVEPNPWGSNLVWTWTRTDTGGETVTLEDDDTRVAHFVAPAPAVETGFAFDVTATGRGTAGVSSPSKATEAEAAAVTVEDTIGPELASGEVGADGDTLTLTFNEDLDIGPGKRPPADAFIVKADGDEVAVQAVELLVDLDHFLLTLPTDAIGARQIVTVSYAVPTTGTVIEDLAGNDAVAFTDKPVTNNSMVVNTTPPVLTGAEVGADGDTLTLTFNEDLDIGPDKRPPADAFTVKADGVEVTVEAVDSRRRWCRDRSSACSGMGWTAARAPSGRPAFDPPAAGTPAPPGVQACFWRRRRCRMRRPAGCLPGRVFAPACGRTIEGEENGPVGSGTRESRDPDGRRRREGNGQRDGRRDGRADRKRRVLDRGGPRHAGQARGGGQTSRRRDRGGPAAGSGSGGDHGDRRPPPRYPDFGGKARLTGVATGAERARCPGPPRRVATEGRR